MKGQIETDGTVMVDNWILQLACEVIDNAIAKASGEARYRSYHGYECHIWEDYKILDENEKTWNCFTSEHVKALLQVLDLIIVYDRLVHDRNRTFIWKESASHDLISPILQPISFTEEDEKGELGASLSFAFFDDSPIGVVREGALHYLTLSNYLCVPYWPAPKRAQFLAEHLYYPQQQGGAIKFRNLIDREINDIIHNILDSFSSYGNDFIFPNFGSVILANCTTPAEILPTCAMLILSKIDRQRDLVCEHEL